MKIRFEKMSGAGNDFVVVDNRNGVVRDGAALARKICDRHWGVGADGLLLAEKSTVAAFRMMYFNADGSYGGMCGNGGRCMADYAVRKGIAPPKHEFDALDHVYSAQVEEGSVKLRMKDPSGLKRSFGLPVEGKLLPMTFVDTGSPHVVVLASKVTRKGLDAVDVQGLGRTIRSHRRFKPAGVNVNFVELQGSSALRIRTYERGVEAETLACGTGSIAAGIVAHLDFGMATPVKIVPKGQRDLFVDFVVGADGGIFNVTLEGPAETVFEGEFEI